ncbi:hypothetical protein DOY81_006470, partial [Sarcophaga bullata]
QRQGLFKAQHSSKLILKRKIMYRKHILFGFLLLLITLVQQIAAEDETTTKAPENPTTIPPGETAEDSSNESLNEMDRDYLEQEEEMFERNFYLFNT